MFLWEPLMLILMSVLLIGYWTPHCAVLGRSWPDYAESFCPGLAVNLHNKAPWKGQGYQTLAEDVLPLTQQKEGLIRTEIINLLNVFSWGSYLVDNK